MFEVSCRFLARSWPHIWLISELGGISVPSDIVYLSSVRREARADYLLPTSVASLVTLLPVPDLPSLKRD